jgi:hypothetical protein
MLKRQTDSKSPRSAGRSSGKKATKTKTTPAKSAEKRVAVKRVSVVASASAPVTASRRARPALQVLTNPLPPTDPTTLELLNLGGPALDTGELMKAWGISREAISQKRKERKLLGVVHGNTTLHPRWQFDAHLDLLPWVAAVLQAMPSDVTPRFALRFFVYVHPALNGKRPVEMVDTAAGLKRIKTLAATVGEQGAR